MRILAPLAAAVLLTACGERAAPPEQPAPPTGRVGEAEGPAPSAPAQIDSSATVVVPEQMLGRWAPSADLCEGGPYVFEAQSLSAPGGVLCRFDRVTAAGAGIDILARCAEERPDQTSLIRLSLPDARTMSVAGGPWGEAVTLRRCEG